MGQAGVGDAQHQRHAGDQKGISGVLVLRQHIDDQQAGNATEHHAERFDTTDHQDLAHAGEHCHGVGSGETRQVGAARSPRGAYDTRCPRPSRRLAPPGRRPKLLAVLLACALLLACSTVKLAYNNLPGLGYWWLDGYLDLNAAQGPRLRDRLADLLAWHRRNELPHLTRLLGRAQAMAPLDLQPNDACALVEEEIEARLLAVARQAEPAAAEIALSLDQTQLVQLERKYSEVNATYRKDWLALRPPARVRKRYQQFLERGEDFYGPLDEAQQELLRRQVTQSVFNPSSSMWNAGDGSRSC